MKSVGYVQRRCLPRTSRRKSYATSTITAFLDSLADRTPAPGGGATAALHLGQAAALVSMVARYSTGPRYAEHAAAIDGICSSADAIRERPLHFAEADMAAFSSVIDAYRMPKSTESEATERDRVIGAAGSAERCKLDVEHVVGLTTVGVDAVAIPDRRNIGAVTDDVLGEQKPLRQFDIGTRGVHRHGKR